MVDVVYSKKVLEISEERISMCINIGEDFNENEVDFYIDFQLNFKYENEYDGLYGDASGFEERIWDVVLKNKELSIDFVKEDKEIVFTEEDEYFNEFFDKVEQFFIDNLPFNIVVENEFVFDENIFVEDFIYDETEKLKEAINKKETK